MGQKTNPNILRLGKISDWKYKYFEKKSNELSIYTFKNLEIENFITRFLKVNGLTVHEIKLYYFNDILHIFISYFLTLQTVSIINSTYKTKKIKLAIVPNQIKRKYLKNFIKVKKNVKKYIKYDKLNYTKSIKRSYTRGYS